MASHHNNDRKYLQKYNDLKQKVKEIEQDNERLQIKVLKTKRNIQRLRIERSILYERLQSMPPPDAHLPPPQPPYPYHPEQVPPHAYPQDIHHAPPPPHSAEKDRRRLDPPRGHPDALPYPISRPPSPPRHHPSHYPPAPPHMQMDIDSRSRRHPGPHTPPSLPPPQTPQYPPHVEDHHHYPPPRRDLGGPGLPPMRTHPDVPPPPHNGYASHPMHPPGPYADDRAAWERDRDREREREREYYPPIRERDPIPNGAGYRDPGPSHRYDVPPPSHPLPPQNGNNSPEAMYGRPRGGSQSYVRGEYPPPGPPPPPHAYPGDYGPSESHARRRSFAEMSDERTALPDPHAPPHKTQRRGSMDDYAEREVRRRDRDRDRDEAIPRVREGDAME
ncbi:hypothetical protein M422DRAFT_30410 [Sphaerobolus stellatus SS14]|uniref:INO80 complex subunit F domain-containing protein n=1 Tax=Sphaerobolus stellatus (strain SS14) TaxID=990650 RepID=A0A0C9VYX8_SPHS4|nr:hypothetical protein M422DRAFT_30410 [Sphaerobolus stellatus SS14]